VNASGHSDELTRHYYIKSITGTAITIDAAWIAMGSSLAVASANGGPPGILYELLVSAFYYAFINASLAELASSIPSSGGVYHYASVTAGPRYGRPVGFFAGIVNLFAWLFGVASSVIINSTVVLEIYALYHPEFTIKAWHIFVTFLILNTATCLVVIYCNRIFPAFQSFGGVVMLLTGVITIIVVTTMASEHASNAFVWTQWSNVTGWPDGIAFIAGMLNGAFTIGTPDSITHMAEEMPTPRKDLPKAIALQLIFGTITAFIFAVAIMYGVTNFDAILDVGDQFPLTQFYAQATGSRAATTGLLTLAIIPGVFAMPATYVSVGRTLWTLARDNVLPFSPWLAKSSTKLSCPVHATLVTYVLTTALGAIRLGSPTAFGDIVASYVILTTMSYLLAILPHLLTGRRNVPIGPFWMGRWGYAVNTLAVISIIVTNIFYCFPFFLPVTTASMNYNSVILVGLLALTCAWWLIHGTRHYAGPRIPHL
ncbi:choline transport protein, partial [Punctularia strigosozonata HHB-11173 SS5]|uniref:choline transport protein n=1 Tax=Punctularia strigosozonata (strain HHB-11173) TaxID=741275 RepID=UPI0004416945